jgi:hypothetical protein
MTAAHFRGVSAETIAALMHDLTDALIGDTDVEGTLRSWALMHEE